MEVRKEDRCQIGKSWVIAKDDFVTGESFAEEADKWLYLVDARGIDDLDAKLAHLDEDIAATEAATEAAQRATTESRQQTEASREALEVFNSVYHKTDLDEWLYAICDAKGYLLWGIRRDGSVFQEKGIPEEVRAWLERLHTLEDYDDGSFLYAICDAKGNIVWGIRKSGEVYEPRGIPAEAQAAILALNKRLDGMTSFQIIESDDYAYVLADAENNVMFGVDHKGRVMVNGMKGVVTVEQFKSIDYLFACTDSAGNLLFGIRKDGTFCVSKFELPKELAEQIAELTGQKWMTEDAEEQEFIYKIQDADGHIVFGVFYSGDVYIPKGEAEETKRRFERAEERMSALELLIKNNEFKTKIDFSDKTFLQIPEPRYAVVNILSGYNLSNLSKAGRGGAVEGVNYNLPTEVEFWDMQGNYFKKWTLMSAQGNSSMGFIKKNIALDFFNESPASSDFNEDNTFVLRIGNWVAQDSWHLKAYYTDFFRGVGPCSYDLYEQIVNTRGNRANRPWKKMLIDMSKIGTTTKSFNNPIQDDYELQYDTGARCFPAGFPVIVFQNGEFYGIYAWQIKKHRDNYHMSKSKPKHIHLDGDLHQAYVWNGRNNIRWTGFEMRNPKKLVYAAPHGGSYKYDADVAQDEIAGTDGENYKGAWDAAYNEGNGYEANAVVDWTDANGDEHQMINTVDGNTKEPAINFEKEQNIDKDPDFKNKTKCGWVNCTNTVKVKDSIMNLSDRMAELGALRVVATSNGNISIDSYGGDYDEAKNFGKGVWVTSGSRLYMSIHSSNTGNAVSDTDYWVDITEAMSAIKSTWEKYFDVENMIDYIIVSDLIKNSDGFAKNWQWFTYDGKKWFVGLYDVDMSFGGHFQGNQITSPLTGHINSSMALPNGYIIMYYSTELKARYAELMDAGIISATNIFAIVKRWYDRIGEPFYAMEWEKWPASPCIGESTVRTSHWQQVTDEDGNPVEKTTTAFIAEGVTEFDPANVKKDGEGNPIYIDEDKGITAAYLKGEHVFFGLNSVQGFYEFEAVEDIPTIDVSSRTDSGKRVVTAYSPISYFRHTDNIYRIQKWIEKEVENMNTVYDYTASIDPSTIRTMSNNTINDIINGN